MFMTPKAYMITSLTPKGLHTELSYLAPADLNLGLVLLCYCLPEFGELCKKEVSQPIIMRRNYVAAARTHLVHLAEIKEASKINDVLKKVEKKYNITGHEKTNNRAHYETLISHVKRFLDKGYQNSMGDTFDLVIS